MQQYKTNVVADVKTYVLTPLGSLSGMDSLGERVQAEREALGWSQEQLAEQVRKLGGEISQTGIDKIEKRGSKRPRCFPELARALRVRENWLLTGRGSKTLTLTPVRDVEDVPLVGYVGAGAQTHRYATGQGPFEMVARPPGASGDTVAVEVRGQSMRGRADEGDLIYYDERHDPPHEALIGKLCVVGLNDDMVLVKKLMPGRGQGLFDLYSENADPMLDQEVAWAARVLWIRPR